MYLHTFGERENGSIFEESLDGKNLSKLNLCDDGKCQPAATCVKGLRSMGGVGRNSHHSLLHPCIQQCHDGTGCGPLLMGI